MTSIDNLEKRLSGLEKRFNRLEKRLDVSRKAFWTCPEDKPEIEHQLNPVFPDYVDRINSIWNAIPGNNGKSTAVYDYELLTKDEIRRFEQFTPPVWFNRLTVDIINSGDIYNRKYNITEFKFKYSSSADSDCVITTDQGTRYIAHDNVSDGFAIF